MYPKSSYLVLIVACHLLMLVTLSKGAPHPATASETASNAKKCDYTRGRWLSTSAIPGYQPPYPDACIASLKCPQPLPGQKRPAAYAWLPDPPCSPQHWRKQSNQLLTMYRDSTMAFIGDSFNSAVVESLKCILAQASPYQAETIKIGQLKYSCLRFIKYNMTVMSISSGYLVNNPAYSGSNVTYPNPRWTVVLPRTRAAVFTAGHWFFHEKQPPPLDRLRSAFALTRNHLQSTNYSGRALALSFSPLHVTKACSVAKAPLPASSSPAAIANVTVSNAIPALRAQKWVLRGSRLRLVDVTTMSRFRVDAHLRRKSEHERMDCSHWCLPGVPDSWNQILISHLLGQQD
ncbi:hypothetical protein CLOM_g17121 [Closterium sp. NIES-68]|nr:hypothetical protein CLOM_g17121 [Closterium sp. NIES-68]